MEKTKPVNEFSKIAVEYFNQGYSCSESIIKAACKSGILNTAIDPDVLNMAASSFSGAMGTHECLCGAISGSQLVLGFLFGRKNPHDDPYKIKKIAKEFIVRFKDKRKITCCKALRAKYKGDPAASRANCCNIIVECAEIIQAMVSEKAYIAAP